MAAPAGEREFLVSTLDTFVLSCFIAPLKSSFGHSGGGAVLNGIGVANTRHSVVTREKVDVSQTKVV